MKQLKNYSSEFVTISNKSKVINEFVSSIKNPFMSAEIKSDYEVVLQYQNIFGLENYNEFTNLLKKTIKKFFLKSLKTIHLNLLKYHLPTILECGWQVQNILVVFMINKNFL